MKRSIFVATLALTPTLLHAQAASPAQPAVLQARVSPVAALVASEKKAGKSSAEGRAASVRVSTGVVAPRLLQPVSLTDAKGTAAHVAGKSMEVVVTLTVDATGKPENIAISQSADQNVDAEVVAAIAAARFQPGTLDGQPFALPVRMLVMIPRGVQY